MKIEKLTKEQEAYLPVFREKYLGIACDGKRIDRERLEPAITRAYDFIGKKKPLVIILQSPQQSMMAIAFMKKFAAGDIGEELVSQLRSQLESQLWSQLRSQLRSQLVSQLWSQLWSQLVSQLWSQLWSQLVSQLESQLRSQLGSQLRSQLVSQLESQLWSQLESQLWSQLESQLGSQLESQNIYDGNYMLGSHDLFWIAWARFSEHIGVKLEEDTKTRLTIIEDISTQCEWWWPYDGICFVSEKPTEVNWDGDVLHGEKRPAVLYEDGYAVYSWRGTNVPKEWIESPETLSPEMAITWENVEQRRCIAEILGWHNILAEKRLNARTVDKDIEPTIGELIEVDIPDIGTERFLKVVCGTGRDFALPVPPDIKTALEAQAWLNFCEPEDILKLEVRT